MPMVDSAALLRRAGDLKRELVAYCQQPRYDRAVSGFLAEYGHGLEDVDEQRWMLLWDCFVLEHRLANGRTVVEQFVEARQDLSAAEREMVLGWRDVVQGSFAVLRQDGPVLVVESLLRRRQWREQTSFYVEDDSVDRWCYAAWLIPIRTGRVSSSGGF